MESSSHGVKPIAPVHGEHFKSGANALFYLFVEKQRKYESQHLVWNALAAWYTAIWNRRNSIIFFPTLLVLRSFQSHQLTQKTLAEIEFPGFQKHEQKENGRTGSDHFREYNFEEMQFLLISLFALLGRREKKGTPCGIPQGTKKA